ncbi:MAG: PEGA domain-containing protein [Nannocystaceae bacterium]
MVGARCLALVVATSVWASGLPVSGLATTTAAAAEPASAGRLAILPLAIDGEISDADRSDLTRALVTGFQRGSFEVLEPEQVGEVGPCTDAACVTGVAGKTGAAYVARPSVRINDRDYAIKVELLSGKNGERIALAEDACEICGVVDASGLLDSAAASLGLKLESLAKGPATLVLRSEPEGAVVLIDGNLFGTAPVDQPITPGKHLVRVSQDGYIPIEREVTFVEGVREELTITLEKVPSALPGRGWGWASLSVGVAALGGAVFLTYMHDRPYKVGDACSVPAPDPGYNVMPDPMGGGDICKQLWNTKWGAISAGIAGAALTTLGVLVLIDNFKRSDRKRNKAVREKKTSFGIGPGSVMIRGRF